MITWWMPTTPYTPVDAVNRAALSTGGILPALVNGSADFNGHSYKVHQTLPDRSRDTYTVSYFWAGLCYVARGVPFADALTAALKAARKGRGGSVIVEAASPTVDAICREQGLVPYVGPKTAFDHIAATMPWQCGGTWLGHTSVGYAHDAVSLERQDGIPIQLFLDAASYEDWKARIAVEMVRRRSAR